MVLDLHYGSVGNLAVRKHFTDHLGGEREILRFDENQIFHRRVVLLCEIVELFLDVEQHRIAVLDDRGDRGLHNAAERVVLLGCRPLCAAAECGLDKVAVGILGVPDIICKRVDVCRALHKGREQKSDVGRTHHPVLYADADAV